MIVKLSAGAVAALLLAAPAFGQAADRAATAPAGSSGSSRTGTTSAAVEGSSTAKMVDLNSATEQELLSLPDVGRDRAQAIIKNRPYRSPDELVSRQIMPKNEFDEINDRITVR